MGLRTWKGEMGTNDPVSRYRTPNRADVAADPMGGPTEPEFQQVARELRLKHFWVLSRPR